MAHPHPFLPTAEFRSNWSILSQFITFYFPAITGHSTCKKTTPLRITAQETRGNALGQHYMKNTLTPWTNKAGTRNRTHSYIYGRRGSWPRQKHVKPIQHGLLSLYNGSCHLQTRTERMNKQEWDTQHGWMKKVSWEIQSIVSNINYKSAKYQEATGIILLLL